MIHVESMTLGSVAILSIVGRLDAISAAHLQNEIDFYRQHDLVLDLNGLDYISAAGLRVLRNLQRDRGVVRIANPSNRVRDVMQITGLDVSYKLFDRKLDAIHHARPIVNAHTHLELGWLRKGLPGVSGREFTDWLQHAIRDPFRKLSGGWEARFVAAIEAGIHELEACGVTVVGDISETGLSIQPLMQAGMRGIVYIELHGRDPQEADQRLQSVRELIEKWRPRMHGGLKIGLSLHAPYSLHRTLWEKAIEYARTEALPVTIHAAESVAETQYLLDGSGAFTRYYDGLEAFAAPGKSPIAFLEEIGALALKPTIIHAVQVSDEDIARIKAHDCTVIHCPRSNLRLQCGRMPLEKMIAHEIPVLLGTDSLVSSPSLNIFDELDFAVALHHGLVAPQKLETMIHGTLPGMG